MSRIEGSFYLKRVDGGNLLGEYTNNIHFTRSQETAQVKKTGLMPFEGTYASQWFELDGPCTGELVIKYVQQCKDGNNQYTLTWYKENGEIAYTAEAFLADGMLMGHYVNYQ